MKTSAILSAVAMVVSGWITSYAQEIDTEVPGDHFSLEGALELFKKSASPEEFEKMLNSPDSKVNNLDLNGDGYIDYIRVYDRYEGNVHAFILQAVVSETENQDVAVIELEKLANGKAVLQIIGDEDVYGIETIIEPTREVRAYAGTTSTQTVVNVWTWPSVQYIYSPYYAGWNSPWAWNVRPVWWHSWRPIAYVSYYPIWRPYRSYYSSCHTHRVVYADRIYRPYRTTSVVVRNRHNDQLTRYRSANHDAYRNGRTRNEGRSFSYNDRSSTHRAPQRHDNAGLNLNRRSPAQREAVASTNRSASRERTAPADIQRNSTGLKREEAPNRRSGTIYNAPELRTQTPNSPAENRRRFENPVQQRSTTREQSVPAAVQRSSPPQRDGSPDRRSDAVQHNRGIRPEATRPSTVERNRSGSHNGQPRTATRSGEAKRGRQ